MEVDGCPRNHTHRSRTLELIAHSRAPREAVVTRMEIFYGLAGLSMEVVEKKPRRLHNMY